jgi:ribosome-associated protein
MLDKAVIYEVQFEFTRSRGAGGQHVNRTESAAIIRWNLLQTKAFSEEKKARLIAKLQNQLNSEGELLVRSETHRDQDSNRKECLRKLEAILQKALFVPKKRIKTKPTKSSQRKRLESKKIHSEKKKLRRSHD